MTTTLTHDGVIAIGRKVLVATRHAFLRDHGERGTERLQEIGCAAGEDLYGVFLGWLPRFAGVSSPDDLDATTLGDVLTAFFESLGWGAIQVERLGSGGLALTSRNWAEADPREGAEYPSCYFSSGMFADFLTRLADGNAISIMEVTCRSQGDSECRFYAGAPATLDAVYSALADGRDYREIFDSVG